MKKHAAVALAEEAMKSKAKELADAKEAVQRLESEHANLRAAVRKAQEEADSTLPQCRLVMVKWRSNKEEDCGLVVILRKTPGGMLVVRRVGYTGYEYKFKFQDLLGKYTQAEKQTVWSSEQRELRDVPLEYMPPAPTVQATCTQEG